MKKKNKQTATSGFVLIAVNAIWVINSNDINAENQSEGEAEHSVGDKRRKHVTDAKAK